MAIMTVRAQVDYDVAATLKLNEVVVSRACKIGAKWTKYPIFGMQNDISRGLWECGNRRTFAPSKRHKNFFRQKNIRTY